MSEYHIVEVDFSDQEILVESLKEMGYEPQVHETPVQLEGYQGKKRKQLAHIVLPRKQVGSMSNDVGFEKLPAGGFKLHASGFDHNWRTGGKIDKLRQTYGEKRIMRTVNKTSKFSLKSRTVGKEGEIKIRLRSIF